MYEGNTVRLITDFHKQQQREDCEMPYSKSWKKKIDTQGLHVYKIYASEKKVK